MRISKGKPLDVSINRVHGRSNIELGGTDTSVRVSVKRSASGQDSLGREVTPKGRYAVQESKLMKKSRKKLTDQEKEKLVETSSPRSKRAKSFSAKGRSAATIARRPS